MRSSTFGYSALLVHIVVAIAFALTTWIASLLIGRVGRRIGAKDGSYECGMLSQDGIQARFNIKFYLVAMLFILFDIEIVFLYPWAVVYRLLLHEIGRGILWSIVSFSALLLLGYAYALKKGALNWTRLNK